MRREDWDERWRERDLHVRGDASEALAAEVGDAAPGRALDLACGAGRNALWLAERGWRVTAVDFSAVALAQARRLAAERRLAVDWVEADVLDFEPEPGAFDLVLVFFLHLPPAERRAALAKASGAVAPGGTLLLVGHDLANIVTGAPGPSDPAVLYTPWEAMRDLCGLEIERAERLTRRVETPRGVVRAVDALVRASRPGPGTTGPGVGPAG